MPITFDSLQEATEYQARMVRTEQLASKIRKEGNKYVVTLLPRQPVVMHKISKEELKKYRGEAAATHIEDEGTHHIFTTEADTSSMLHELGHARFGHRDIGGVTLTDKIEKEIDAEIYKWQARGKELNPRVAWNAVRQAYLWNPRMNPVSIINAVARKLEERGISMTKEDKEWFVDATMAKTNDPEIEEWKKKMKEDFY